MLVLLPVCVKVLLFLRFLCDCCDCVPGFTEVVCFVWKSSND